MLPSPGSLLLSTVAPKWAALTLNVCTQHCAQVLHFYVLHQNYLKKNVARNDVITVEITYGKDCTMYVV